MHLEKTRYQPGVLAVFLVFMTGICFGEEAVIKNSIPVPDGYVRQTFAEGSYSHWLQNLPLKDQAVIMNYQGRAVESGFYRVWGVVRMPLLFHSDLEQCADFAMRLWAEYHRAAGKLDRLYLFDYGGHKKFFKQSGKTFTQFLKEAFAYSNSYSLKKGCKAVASDRLIPGDMLVQNERGGVGHVSVILDVCASDQGKRLYLVGYSYMPAQEFHIEKAADDYGIKGWFTLEGYTQYLRDYLNFGKPVLRRFD